MKLFIILILLAVFLALIYLRLRPYIRMVQQMFGVVRDARQMGQVDPAQPLRTKAAVESKLVRCAACGTWIPDSRAVKLRASSAAYCSHACLENSSASKSERKRAV